MNWNKIKGDLSKLNLIIALIGIALIIIPLILIYAIEYANAKDITDMVFLIGMTLAICTIPMALIVIAMYCFVLTSTIIAFAKKDFGIKNIIAFLISILAMVVTVGGLIKYFILGEELIDTISRLG